MWIRDLRTKWNLAPLQYLPRFKDGNMLLEALIQYPTLIPAYDQLIDHEDLYNGQASTMEHIVVDLIHMKDERLNIVDQSIGYGTDSHKEQVLVSMWNTAYIKSEDSNVKIFSISDLLFHPNGTGKCEISFTQHLLNLAVTDNVNVKGSWSSTFCPPSAIMDLHWDYHGGSQIIMGISTSKLWLFWPPTEKNLSWRSNHNLRLTTGSITLEAIHNLEGLTLLY
jgi:hypothetical protein